jgi:DNA-binding NarL/FixJ family response regulator
MNDNSRITIMVVDDHPVVRSGLVAILGSQPDLAVVAQASTGLEAIDLFRRHQPDVCLMDLRLPEIGGAEAIRLIRKEFPNSAFIVLTTFHGEEDIHKAMSAGARSYLLKGMSHEELLDAVRKVHAGRHYLPKTVRQSLANRTPSSDLSAREAEILGLIVRGLTNKEIATALSITVGTVKWHVNIIFAKLHVADRTQAAVAALHRGIVELR